VLGYRWVVVDVVLNGTARTLPRLPGADRDGNREGKGEGEGGMGEWGRGERRGRSGGTGQWGVEREARHGREDGALGC